MANLATRAEVKAYAGITSTTQDVMIDILLPKVSKLVRTICKNENLDGIVPCTDVLDGGDPKLILSQSPVVSISSVSRSTDYGVTYTALVQYTDWVYNVKDQYIRTTVGTFPTFVNGYKVIYTAGYDGVPEDLKLAVLDLATYYMKNDAAVHSQRAMSPNTTQVEYISTTNLPAHIKRILDQYTMNYN